MDATRQTYSAYEIASALGVSFITVYKWRKELVASGKLEAKPQYSYREIIHFARLRKQHCGRKPAPDKSELLKRQLRTDGFIR